MDLIKIVLEKLRPGHVTQLYGIVVLRRGDSFVCGETINIRATGASIDDTAEHIYAMSRNFSG